MPFAGKDNLMASLYTICQYTSGLNGSIMVLFKYKACELINENRDDPTNFLFHYDERREFLLTFPGPRINCLKK